ILVLLRVSPRIGRVTYSLYGSLSAFPPDHQNGSLENRARFPHIRRRNGTQHGYLTRRKSPFVFAGGCTRDPWFSAPHDPASRSDDHPSYDATDRSDPCPRTGAYPKKRLSHQYFGNGDGAGVFLQPVCPHADRSAEKGKRALLRRPRTPIPIRRPCLCFRP